MRLLQGREPVELRWGADCFYEFDMTVLQSRDALVFPLGGTPVPLRVTSTISVEGFAEGGLGIVIDRESVTDVDVLPASL